MKLFKTINIFSDGSFYFRYQQVNFIKKNNRNTFQESDDKNFAFYQKKTTKSNTFKKLFNYKNKYS